MSCQRYIGMALHYSRHPGVTLSFRGYAHCSATMLLSLSQQTIPATLLLAALLWGGFTFFYFRRTRTDADTGNKKQQENTITFGNLSLSLQEACFYNERQEKLKLTPMQYTLMEMFYLSSSHLLFKSDICQSLWPGKRQCRRNALHIDTASEAHCRGQQQPQNNNRPWPRLRTGNKNLNIIRIMKTNRLILLGLICLTAAMPATAQSRSEKKTRIERIVKGGHSCQTIQNQRRPDATDERQQP